MKKFNEFINEGLLAAMKPKPTDDIIKSILSNKEKIVYNKDFFGEGADLELEEMYDSIEHMIKLIDSKYGDVVCYNTDDDYIVFDFVLDTIKPLTDDITYRLLTTRGMDFKIYKSLKLIIGVSNYSAGTNVVFFDIEKMREILNEEI